MRKITKRAAYEPASLTVWKRRNPNKRYSQITKQDAKVRQDIRNEALTEQYYLCGHCCQLLSGWNDCHNEHVEAQNLNLNRTLDFNNIIASCNTPNQCGDSHQSQTLLLTPFMAACEIDLEFKLSGRVSGKTPEAIETIRVLNLGDTERNNKSLIEKRKQLSLILLTEEGIEPFDKDDLRAETELLRAVITSLLTPKNGKLQSFSPVVANVLKQWIL